MDKATEQLFREREKRYIDAVQLRTPDRVPTSVHLSYFPARFTGITYKDSYYDFPKWKEAYIKTALWLQPDRCEYFPTQSGRVMEAMDAKTSVWPGHGVGVNSSHQWVEGEYMKEEEYDLFLNDQSDFNLRYLLPRSYGFLEPLAKLPALESMQMMLPYHVLATPEFADMMAKMSRIACEAVEWQRQIMDMFTSLNEVGFPGRTAMAGGGVPYDMISDFLRGMRGAMLDMYRLPDKLLEACDMFCKQTIAMIQASPAPDDGSVKRVFMALHRGSDGFMSLPQFEKFYWPTLKKVLLALVDAGWTPCPFFEGTWDQRLEYLRELPKGKVLCHFAKTDPQKAKAVLGGHLCFMIDVPGFLLKAGAVSEVEDHCRNLIRVCGKDGGFIMTATCLDEAAPKNVKAMMDITKSFGRYA